VISKDFREFIELLTSLKGLSFDDCYDARMMVRIEDTEIAFIDIENLKRNKAATGRAQDLADLEHLAGETSS